MIFKVLFQQYSNEMPTRERTQSIYIEAQSVREVRQILQERNFQHNIEYIQPLNEAHLNYESQSEKFKVENA